MDVGSFYGGGRRSTRVTTVTQALELSSQSKCAHSITILPPATGDSIVDSDTEDVPECPDDDVVFETAGELEFEETVSTCGMLLMRVYCL